MTWMIVCCYCGGVGFTIGRYDDEQTARRHFADLARAELASIVVLYAPGFILADVAFDPLWREH